MRERILKNIGLLIRQARLQKGWTQRELAEKTKEHDPVSINTIKRIETGKPLNYSMDKIHSLKQTLEIEKLEI